MPDAPSNPVVHLELHTGDRSSARAFYADFLGLSVEAFNMGWVARYESPAGEAAVQLVTQDLTAP